MSNIKFLENGSEVTGWEFPETVVGQSSIKEIEIVNKVDAPVFVTFSPVQPEIHISQNGKNIKNKELILAPKEKISIQVEFSPTELPDRPFSASIFFKEAI